MKFIKTSKGSQIEDGPARHKKDARVARQFREDALEEMRERDVKSVTRSVVPQ